MICLFAKHCRAVFSQFCDGSLSPSIPHPYIRGEKLFFIIDPTHNLKNIYNNWQRKGLFWTPTGFEAILPETKADFRHIQQLYEREESNVLKVAHRLRRQALNPSNIQRTCPKLALCKLLPV